MASPPKHPILEKSFKSLLENKKGLDPLNTTGQECYQKYIYLIKII